MTGRALVSRDETIVWDRMPVEALPSACSCLVLGADVTLALCPISTPSCSGSTLGVVLRGWSRIAVSAWARQSGSRQAPRHQNEVSQGWIPGRAAADRNLAFLKASQALPKGQNLDRDPEWRRA